MHCTYLSIFSKENSVGVLKDKQTTETVRFMNLKIE